MPSVRLFTSFPIYSSEHLPDKNINFTDGAIFLINKPQGLTSFKVVSILRRFLKIKKIGHAGTLDPLATGLLILCTGKATKSISQIQELPKRYLAHIRFGASTPSYDADSEINQKAPYEHITRTDIEEALKSDFEGEIEQIPPMYSALKKDGKRLYDLARKGETVEREPRRVTIYETKIVHFSNPDIILDIKCSKGTYIRSIAHDLGKKLGSLAYITKLTRSAIGTYTVEKALTIAELEEIFMS